jgi:hypothetical protein
MEVRKKMETLRETLGLGIDISKKRADICLKNSTVLDTFQVARAKCRGLSRIAS